MILVLQSLANANAAGIQYPWEFNEWMHGETGQPMGYAYQAWSAAMYVYAYETLKTGKLPFFDEIALPSAPVPNLDPTETLAE